MSWLRRNWPKAVLRLCGVLQVFLTGTGLCYVGMGVLAYWSRWGEVPDPVAPFAKQVFVLKTAINVILLFGLMWAGVLLLRLKNLGISASNWLLIAIVVYSFGFDLAFGWTPGTGPIEMSLAATAGIGDKGVSVIVFTGYPLIGFVALNLAHASMVKS